MAAPECCRVSARALCDAQPRRRFSNADNTPTNVSPASRHGLRQQLGLQRTPSSATTSRPATTFPLRCQALLPEQIDAAERIIASLAGHLTLSNPERAKQPYFFDPASGAPPVRELTGIRPPFTARRFGAGGAEEELRQLLRKAQKGTLGRGELGLQGVSNEMLETTLPTSPPILV